MKLSPNFTLAEMTVSQTASRRGIDNTPGQKEIAALTMVCQNVLEPIRAHYKRPVIVSSGYRSPRVNKLVGGSETSQHPLGEAVDFRVPGVSNYELCKWMERKLQYDQLIYEYGESGWVHASWAAKNRNMELTKRRGTRYLPGILK